MKTASLAQLLTGAIVLHQVFVIALLVIRTESRKDHSLAMIAFFSVNLLGSFSDVAGFFAPDWKLDRGESLFLAFGALLGPSLYFYCKALVSPDVLRIDIRLLRHAYPFLVCLLMGGVAAATKDHFVDADQITKETLTSGLLANVFAQMVVVLTLVGSLNFYFIKIISMLWKYKKNKYDYISSMEGHTLVWMGWMIWILAAIWMGIIAIVTFNIVYPGQDKDDVAFALLEAAWVYALSFMVVWQQEIFRPARMLPARPPASEEAGERFSLISEERDEARRYQRSSLDEDRVRRITAKVERAMSQDRLYRNHGITLRNLSDHTRVSENHLSEVLNNHLGRNFYEFINHWRVRDACALLAEPEVPIVAIGEEVGFNSRSTFNAAFKKETGLTPSEYRANLPGD